MATRKNTIPPRPARRDPFIQRNEYNQWKYDAAKPEYFAAALKVLNSAGKVTRQQYLEAMLDMEEKYPGRGWKEELDSLEAFYFKLNLSLKELPKFKFTEVEQWL